MRQSVTERTCLDASALSFPFNEMERTNQTRNPSRCTAGCWSMGHVAACLHLGIFHIRKNLQRFYSDF